MDMIPVANVKALQKVLYITSTAWTEVKVGTLAAPSRKWVQIFNKSPYKIYYSYDNTFNIQGSFAIRQGATEILPLSEQVPVYVRGTQPALSNAQKVIIAEIA